MRNIEQCLSAKDFDKLLQEKQQARLKETNILSRISKIGQQLFIALTKKPEPKIWQKKDHSGNLYWRVYDPKTDRSAMLSSEAEVRSWLEERYYH